jgi:flagellar biosynthesis protein
MNNNEALKNNKLRMLLAIALRYRSGEDAAPEVIAKGNGRTAQHILDLAVQAGVPLHKDADLSQLLDQVEVGSPIPPELYESVARVLSFVYSVEAKAKRDAASA